MKFIELFAGIGGFRLGLERSGHKCVWANEWLERPRRIYKYNFGEYPNEQDIRKITGEEIPRADLLTAGFPCATFSVAGKKTGFCTSDTRGTLFFEICKILRVTKIPYLLLENVKGLLNHDNGRTMSIILTSLDELGYDIQWEVLNSKNFGVPQNRERLFIVGNSRIKSRPKVFPIGSSKEQDDKKGYEEQESRKGVSNKGNRYTGTLDAHYTKGGSTRTFIKQWRRGYFRDYKGDGVPTLTANMGTGGHNVPFVVRPCLTPNRKTKRQRGRRFKENGEIAHTVGVQDRHGIYTESLEHNDIRKLTPLETERLQGLPDNFTKYYDDGTLVSNSERWERCGRTVTIPVIEAIGRKLGYEWY
ncbi:MAG: DNA (cytosine-5-)-methyltransferase [Nanoarchaeota archaeon]|jgi:DNA (cytosine-5)-methyltransferase 1|nr:DNA (cytosine-5-)-methyltransferase [Nanoarchaeota archaeon]|tara:strand:- start:4529 stop:5608 length:1080 start_codon:yes stop_codon:yes gene_type:complete